MFRVCVTLSFVMIRVCSLRLLLYQQDTPLKIKVTTRANAALNAAEVRNLETLRAKNGAGAFSKHFVGFTENMDNYNGR